MAVDLDELLWRELGLLERGQVRLELLDPADADKGRGDARVAQGPGECHLRERLAAPTGDLGQRPHPFQIRLVRKLVLNSSPETARESGGTAPR